MLKEIKSRYHVRIEMFELIDEAERMIAKYGWEERTVYPYSFPMKVTKIIAECKDFDICTSGTREYLVQLANGLVPILNAWEDHENRPKIDVRILATGKIVSVEKDIGMVFIEEGLAVAVQSFENGDHDGKDHFQKAP